MHLLCSNSPEGVHYPATFTATDGSNTAPPVPPLHRFPILCNSRNPTSFLQPNTTDYPTPDYTTFNPTMFPQPRADLIALGMGTSPAKFHHSMPPAAAAVAAAFFPPIVAVGTWHPHSYRPRTKRPTPYFISDILGIWDSGAASDKHHHHPHHHHHHHHRSDSKCLDGLNNSCTAFTKVNCNGLDSDSEKMISRIGLKEPHHDDLVTNVSEHDPTGHPCDKIADSDSKDSGGKSNSALWY